MPRSCFQRMATTAARRAEINDPKRASLPKLSNAPPVALALLLAAAAEERMDETALCVGRGIVLVNEELALTLADADKLEGDADKLLAMLEMDDEMLESDAEDASTVLVIVILWVLVE